MAILDEVSHITKDIYLVGTSFESNGFGVPEINKQFFELLHSKSNNIQFLDIMFQSKHQYPHLSPFLARNIYLIEMRKWISGKNVHIMHNSDPFTTLPVKDISNSARRRIVTVHDFYPFIKQNNGVIESIDAKLKKRTYRTIKDYDFVFARTAEVKESLEKNHGVDQSKIEIQGPIIEIPLLKNNIKKSSDTCKIGYINNFNWNKSRMLKKLIELFKQVKDQSLEFHIYGKNFPFLEEITQDTRIHYHGFLKDSELSDTLTGLDAYVSTSEYEGFGIPIAKAKAHGIPVLCYDGMIPDVMKRNTCIWTQSSLPQILENRSWKNVDTRRGLQDVIPLSPDNVAEQTLKIYGDVFGF